MARTKAFDQDTVVEKAMQVFWSQGYEATSIQDLVEAMGINRGSIYDTFGDKSNLFQVAMRRYMDTAPSARLIATASAAAPRQAIEKFIRMQVDLSCAPEGQRGCLMTNTLTELCYCDKDIAKMLGSGLIRIENAFCILVRRGQEDGEITNAREAHALARFLIAAVQGIKTLAKVNPGREALSDIADIALSNLD